MVQEPRERARPGGGTTKAKLGELQGFLPFGRGECNSGQRLETRGEWSRWRRRRTMGGSGKVPECLL